MNKEKCLRRYLFKDICLAEWVADNGEYYVNFTVPFEKLGWLLKLTKFLEVE
jgi:hypothetical protein